MKLRKNDIQLDERHRREGLRSGERPVALPTSFFYEGMSAANRPHPEVLQQEVMGTRRNAWRTFCTARKQEQRRVYQ